MLVSNDSALIAAVPYCTDYVPQIVLHTLEVWTHFMKYQFFSFSRSAASPLCFRVRKVKDSIRTMTVITNLLSVPH